MVSLEIEDGELGVVGLLFVVSTNEGELVVKGWAASVFVDDTNRNASLGNDILRRFAVSGVVTSRD